MGIGDWTVATPAYWENVGFELFREKISFSRNRELRNRSDDDDSINVTVFVHLVFLFVIVVSIYLILFVLAINRNLLNFKCKSYLKQKTF